MKKTRILFLIGSFGVGGKERQLHVIMEHLPRDRYEVYFLFKSTGAFFSTIKDKLSGYKNLDQAHFNFKSVSMINQYINQINPDVVFSFAETTSHIALLCNLFRRKKFKLFNGAIRNAPDHLGFIDRIESWLYNFYKNVVANSYAGLKAFHQAGKKGRHVLYNGCFSQNATTITKEQALEMAGFEKHLFNVVMVGSLRKHNPKDPYTFLKTALEVQSLDKNIRFYLVGDGEMIEELKAYCERHQIQNLFFLGYRSDIKMILQASDLSVLTSKTEGVSNSIIESMSFGVPVIATSGGGTPEVIVPNENGFILPYQDYQGIASLILELKNNPARLLSIGEKAKQTVKEKFSIPAMIQEFEKIIHASD